MSTATAVSAVKTAASKDEADIRALIERHHKAYFDKDAAAIAAAFSSDAAIFDLAPPLLHAGMDIRGKQAWLDSWNGPIVLETRDFHLTVSGDDAFGYGFLRMTGYPPEAKGGQVSFWMRETLCLRREADGWRIVHRHESVPFYMDGSLRPAFDLNPPAAGM
jgi:ketosteroid isomerase-like protein